VQASNNELLFDAFLNRAIIFVEPLNFTSNLSRCSC
jgi:hypothetical protein